LEFEKDYGYTIKYKDIAIHIDSNEIIYKGKSFKVFSQKDFIE